jgi:hypothetical protein
MVAIAALQLAHRMTQREPMDTSSAHPRPTQVTRAVGLLWLSLFIGLVSIAHDNLKSVPDQDKAPESHAD